MLKDAQAPQPERCRRLRIGVKVADQCAWRARCRAARRLPDRASSAACASSWQIIMMILC
jgi:hypothetical protein